MFFYEGQSCPVCGKRFAETDDIVTCPVCGAPHHRACWQADGHCHFESAHGTPEQWSRTANTATEDAPQSTRAENLCPHCGAPNVQYAEFCGRCGGALNASEWQSTPPHQNGTPYHEYTPFRTGFDPLGGVAHNEPFDEDVTAEDLAVSVGANTMYYLPRFQKIRDGRTVQWNWAAFLITPYWLLYRKQYVSGVLVSLFYLVYFALNYLVFHMSGALGITDADPFMVSYEAGYLPVLFLLSIAMLVIHLLFGLFANYLYLHTCKKRVRTAKETDPADFRTTLKSLGGVSLVWGAVSYFGINLFTTIIQMVFTSL